LRTCLDISLSANFFCVVCTGPITGKISIQLKIRRKKCWSQLNSCLQQDYWKGIMCVMWVVVEM
jgi:hypothetical protein